MKFDEKFITVISVVLVINIWLAYMDILGSSMWGTLGGWNGVAYLTAFPYYMALFWSSASFMILLVAGVYYILKKDLSESLAIFLVGLLSIFSGLEDVIYYLLHGWTLDSSMPWLMNSPASTLSQILGMETVTPISLLGNIILFGFIAYYLTNWLYAKKW